MKRVRIALSGAGGYGGFYLPYLLENKWNLPMEFAGVVEPFAGRVAACRTCEAHGVKVFDSLESFYREREADLVILACPIPYHAEQSLCAVAHGSHVLCEKPTAALPADAQRMADGAKQAGREIFVGFQLSFTGPILALKRDILSGRYGRVLSAKCMTLWERDFAYYGRGSGWAGKLALPDGRPIRDSVASNATAHYLHNLLFLLGGTMETAFPAQVEQAELRRANRIETFDTCAVRLTGPEGAPILFLASHATCGNLEPVFSLRFEHGEVFFTQNGAPRLWAVTDAGETVEYGDPTTEEETAQKLIRTVRWVAGECEKPPCTVPTTMPFLHAMDAIFTDWKVEPYSEEEIFTDEFKGRVFVPGLYERMVERYRRG